MTSSRLLSIDQDKNDILQTPKSLSNRYSICDHGHGNRTYSYDFDLFDYEPEQITVLLDDYGRLRIRARRPSCHEFRREYDLGGTGVETRLVRNTIDSYGRLRVDIDVRPRQYDVSSINNNNILTFDLQGYRPKNTNVRIDENGLLKINAQHTDDTLGHRISREYYRQYQLPKNTNSDQIRARIDENQLLTIELPQPLDKQNQSWQPHSPDYGLRPYEKSCCCNMM